MMCALPRTLCLLLAAVLFSSLHSFAKTNYKAWLQEEVVWIISKKEREQFHSLKFDADRDEFIKRFWERRDPTPSTPRNEFKEEHYRRFAHTLKNFQEGIPGWKTDRGRIYIIHGPPDREDFFASNPRMNIEGRTDVARQRTPNTIIWIYRENPNARFYRGELALVFQPSSGLSRQNLTLGESKTAQQNADQLNRQLGLAVDQNVFEGDVRYRLIVAGPPAAATSKGADIPNAGLGESTQYIEDLLRSPGDVLEELAAKAAARDSARRELRTAVETRLSFGSLPIELISRKFFEDNGGYRVEVQIDIPPAELARHLNKESGKTDRIDLYCAVARLDGEVADEFVDSVDISTENLGGEDLHYLNSFSLSPGSYVLKAAIRNSGLERLGYRELVLNLPQGRGDGLQISDLRLTNRIAPADPSQTSAPPYSMGSIRFGQALLTPHPSSSFKPSDTLFAFVQILLPAGKRLEDCELSLGMRFIGEAGVIKRIDARRIEESNSTVPGLVQFVTAVPISEIPPGSYLLQVQAIDHSIGKFSIARAPLRVVPRQ
jgi:GWxTD domain-containing protein